MGLGDFSESISSNWRVILVTSLIMLFVVVVTAILVFFVVLTPADQVMVPNIVGKDLNSAILELQAKELNTRLQLRYSDSPDDEGLVLEQNPAPGAIIKAGRKVKIVVSQGTIMNNIENYIGKNVDEVKQDLQVLFTSGSKYLVFVKEPNIYRYDNSAPGTILEQDPAPGSELLGRTTLSFVVSKGPEKEMIAIPDIEGLALNKLYEAMANTKLRFDFYVEESAEIKAPKVLNQSLEAGLTTTAYSNMEVKVAIPSDPKGDTAYGVYAIDLPIYPYPLDLSLDVINPSGERTQLVFCKCPGGRFTVPYAVKKGSILILTVLGKEVQSTEVSGN